MARNIFMAVGRFLRVGLLLLRTFPRVKGPVLGTSAGVGCPNVNPLYVIVK